jgi:Zn-dependent protease
MKAVAFRIGNIPVRINASFFLMTVFLGMGSVNDLPLLLTWFVVVLVSVLIHEMGHALMGKAFGLSPEIDLHSMGGTTSWSGGRNVGNGKGILISLAGPLAGLSVGVFAWLAIPIPASVFGQKVYDFVWFVNVVWSVFNLLPMLPLDGGNVLRSTLNAMTGGKGEIPSRIIGLILAVLLGAVVVFKLHDWWLAMLGLLFAVQNWRGLQDYKDRNADAPFKAQLDAAYEALKVQDARRVLELSVPVIDSAKTWPVRAEAIHLAAYGLLLARRPADADEMIARLPRGYPPNPAYAQLRAQVVGQ